MFLPEFSVQMPRYNDVVFLLDTVEGGDEIVGCYLNFAIPKH